MLVFAVKRRQAVPNDVFHIGWIEWIACYDLGSCVVGPVHPDAEIHNLTFDPDPSDDLRGNVGIGHPHSDAHARILVT